MQCCDADQPSRPVTVTSDVRQLKNPLKQVAMPPILLPTPPLPVRVETTSTIIENNSETEKEPPKYIEFQENSANSEEEITENFWLGHYFREG